MSPLAFSGRSRRHACASARQDGAALVVILLLLLVVTLLGLAGIRGALLQERMAANAMARSFAFNAAETVLREAEAFAAGRPPAPASGCSNGVCVEPKQMTPAWQTNGFWTGNNGWKLAAAEVNGIQARYIVEKYGEKDSACVTAALDMSSSCGASTIDIYRIVVHSRGGDGGEVTLQTLYQVP